jgi:hypothetical protein
MCSNRHTSPLPMSTRLVWVNYSSVFGTKALSTLQFTRARASEWTAAAAAVVAASPPPRPPVPSSSAPQRHQVGSGSTSNFGWCALIHSSAIVPPVHSLLLLLLLLPAPAPKHMHSPAVTLATQSVRVSDSLALAAALWQVSYHGSIHGGGQRVGYTLRPSSTAASSRRRWTAEPARCPIRPSP